MWLVPPRYLVIDVETIAGCPEDAEAAVRRTFAPNPNWKPATIGERYLQALQERRERLALLDNSPIVSVALSTDTDCRLLHSLPLEETALYGIPLESCPNEKSLLARLRDYLESCGESTLFVGHNIVGFDLPRLRLRYLANGLRIPRPLTSMHQPVYDTMLAWSELFSVEGGRYISLHDCLQVARIPSHKNLLSGADVQRLFDSGDYRTLALYAILDVLAEKSLYLCMTGQADDRLLADDEDQQSQKAEVHEIPEATKEGNGGSETSGSCPTISPSVRDILASMGISI